MARNDGNDVQDELSPWRDHVYSNGYQQEGPKGMSFADPCFITNVFPNEPAHPTKPHTYSIICVVDQQSYISSS